MHCFKTVKHVVKLFHIVAASFCIVLSGLWTFGRQTSWASAVWATRRLGDRDLGVMVGRQDVWASRHLGDILGYKTFQRQMWFRETFQLLILSRVLHKDKWAMKSATDRRNYEKSVDAGHSNCNYYINIIQ